MSIFFRIAIGLFMMISLRISAQTIQVEVVDSISGHPIQGLNVTLEPGSLQYITDAKGKFQFTIDKRSKQFIKIRMVGYHGEEYEISDSLPKLWLIELCPDDIHLDGFTLHGNSHNSESQSLVTADIDKLKGKTFGDIAKNIPGITLISTGPGITKPMFRGLTGSRLMYIYNGFRLEGQQWGIDHAPEIDPMAISKINIVKGVGALMYGSEAIGGAFEVAPVNYRLVNGSEYIIQGNIYSNNQQSGLGMIYNSRKNKHALRIISSGKIAGDAKTPEYILSNTGFRNAAMQTSYIYGNPNNFIELNYQIFYNKNAILRASHIGNISDLYRAIASETPLYIQPFTYKINKPFQEVTHQNFSWKWNKDLRNRQSILIQQAVQYNRRKEYDADKIYNPNYAHLNVAAFSLALLTHTTEVKYKWMLNSQWTIHSGVLLMYQNNQAWGKRFLIPNYQLYTGGIYALAKFAVRNIKLEACIRYEQKNLSADGKKNFIVFTDTKKYNGINGGVSALVRINKSFELRYTSITGWRPPNISELYSNGLHGATGNFEKGNSFLQKEKSWNNECVIRFQNKKLFAYISLYHQYILNYIYIQPNNTPTLTISGAFPTMIYNQGNVTIKGIDGKLDWEINRRMDIQFSGSIIQSKNLTTSEPLWMSPANRIQATYIYIFKDTKKHSDNQINLSWTYVAKQTRTPVGIDYALPPSAYQLFQLQAESTINLKKQSVKCILTIQNIFNKEYRDFLYRYRYFANEQGRDIQLSFQIPIHTIKKHIHN